MKPSFPVADVSNVDTANGVGFEEAQPATKGAKGKAKKEPIPAKYNAETILTAVVKEGSNTIDFKLESK